MEKSQIDTLQKVELAEGVEVHLRVAGPVARCLAWLIDSCIIFGVMIALSIVVGMVVGGIFGEQVAQGILFMSTFLLLWFYFVFFEAGKTGATPGKRKMGLKVVTRAGGPVSMSQAIVRNFLRGFDFLPVAYGVGLVTCLSTKKFQRLGDLVADTVVIYGKTDAVVPRPFESSVQPVIPQVALTREEQQALLLFAERTEGMSAARTLELANHAAELSGPNNTVGLKGMARWIHESK
jgi:uncharacterized RDD family membrane protein YckC